ncbi:MAG: M1 family metallopeptidase [Bacteroidia bacterium]
MGDEKKSKNFSVSDPHSYSNPTKIRVKHMDLDLEILWETHILKGSVTLTLDKKENADTLILDTRQLKISVVQNSSGKLLNFWLGDSKDIFGAPLYIVLGKVDDKVKIVYETYKDAAALQWVSPAQTHDKKEEFLYSQSQAILARSWVPCQDAPAVKFTYTAKIKTKPGYLALMSATNPQQSNESGIYNFEMEQPISSYLLALSSGKIVFKSLGKDCGIYAEPGMLEKAEWEFADMQKMIDEAGKLYGTYMWKRYDVLVLPPSFPFGGMENPRLTFATPTVITGDRSQVSLIAHELAHSWSGNLVTNATWDDFWLNEGFTNYFEQRIMEQIYGKPYDEMRQVLAWNDLEKTIAEMKADSLMTDTKLKLDLRGRDPDEGLSDVAYDKGRFFLCHLEKIVGKKNWDEFLNKYFKTNAFSYMDTEGFIDYLNKELLDKNPDWKKAANIQEWVYGEGMPKGAVKPISSELNKVDAMLAKYFNQESIDYSNKTLKPTSFDTTGFTTHHWQYLLRQFGKKATLEQVIVFDQIFKFSNRGNAEILCDWYTLSVKVDYPKNRPQIEKFLTKVGRRKFLMPIYEALAKTPEGKIWAKKVFEKAKAGYHSVSANSVAEILK